MIAAVPVCGTQVGVAKSEYDSVGIGNVNRSGILVNAGSQDEVLAGCQRGIDLGQSTRSCGNEEGADRQRSACIAGAYTSAGPARSLGIRPQRRRKDPVVAAAVHVQEWLLAADRRRRQHGIRVGPIAKRLALSRGARHPGENKIPNVASKAPDRAVARILLLLRAAVDVSIDNAIGQKSAAGLAAV